MHRICIYFLITKLLTDQAITVYAANPKSYRTLIFVYPLSLQTPASSKGKLNAVARCHAQDKTSTKTRLCAHRQVRGPTRAVQRLLCFRWESRFREGLPGCESRWAAGLTAWAVSGHRGVNSALLRGSIRARIMRVLIVLFVMLRIFCFFVFAWRLFVGLSMSTWENLWSVA